MEPYNTNIDSIIIKQDLIGRLLTVHGTVIKNRGLKPIIQKTRAIKAGEIHELILTDSIIDNNRIINNAAYIGFVVFLTSGLLKNEDKLYIRNNEIGVVIGFDETHIPNHLNILIYSKKFKTGLDLGLNCGNVVYFIK